MWEFDDWKWLNRVQELLSQEKTDIYIADNTSRNLEFLKKRKRSPRKKEDYPMPCRAAVEDHPTPTSEKPGIKLTVKNLGRSPLVTFSQKCSSKKISFKNPNTSSAKESSNNLGRNLKRRRDCEEEQSTTKNHSLSRNLPQSSPQLPLAFKNYILETGGCPDNVVLVIQKELFESDLSKNLNRLSIPYSKVNAQFLTSEQVDCLDIPKAGIQATIVEPSFHECGISLRNWKSNSMFALVTPWNEVCRRNQLRKGNIVQLWSFRRNSELCFGLVLIK